MIAKVVFQPATHEIKARTGFNGGLPFLVRLSKAAPVAVSQVEALLGKIAGRLAKASFYPLLKAKTIQINVVSEDDLRQIGYIINGGQGRDDRYNSPEQKRTGVPLGVSEPFEDCVYINAEVFQCGSEPTEVLIHELLHAYSTKLTRYTNGNAIVNGGLMEAKIMGPEQMTSGQYLNEGLTEYLRVLTGGPEPQGFYRTLYQGIVKLIARIGDRFLIDAYFSGDRQRLQAEIDRLYGANGYDTLTKLADIAGSADRDKLDQDTLLGFVEHGFERFAMLEWGYSPENRIRMPRRLSAAELPPALSAGLDLERLMVYTNLKDKELKAFWDSLSAPEKFTHTGSSKLFASPVAISDFLNDRARQGHNLLFIRQVNDYRGQSQAIVETHSVEPAELAEPQFLGRAVHQQMICSVYL
jgi:hypothetical protein